MIDISNTFQILFKYFSNTFQMTCMFSNTGQMIYVFTFDMYVFTGDMSNVFRGDMYVFTGDDFYTVQILFK